MSLSLFTEFLLETPGIYTYFTVLAFWLGACMGSFLNVCIFRIPEEQSVVGRRVRIELDRGPLTLAEVEVWSGGRNVAREGTASQDSTAWDGVAARAIDGRNDGGFSSGTQTHTAEGGTAPWWEVDLGADYPIESIRLWNRTDGSLGQRLDGYRLQVLDAAGRPVWEVVDQPAPGMST